MPNNRFYVFAISDATGDLAHSLTVACVHQFPHIDAKIVRKGRINSREQIVKIVDLAKRRRGVILFTMVSHEFRHIVLSESQKEGVVAMDIMGPALDMLSTYFHELPSDEVGLQYKATRAYYKRTEALEFSVKHDDGLGLETLDQADIVLLGASRTSKTPLSIYLAYRGFRSANVPIVLGSKLPEAVSKIDPNKLFGVTVSEDQLMSRRSTRLKKLGRPDSEIYAQKEHVREELCYARKIFAALKGVRVIDVTGKAIEEIAGEIIDHLSIK